MRTLSCIDIYAIIAWGLATLLPFGVYLICKVFIHDGLFENIYGWDVLIWLLCLPCFMAYIVIFTFTELLTIKIK